MAEARSAVSQPRVEEFEEGRDAKKDFIQAWRKALFRRFYRTRNLIRNGMWPTHIYNLALTTAAFSILLIGQWEWAEPINRRLLYLGSVCYLTDGVPFYLRVLLISFVGGVVFFVILMYKRRWLLRILLNYRGWMYQPLRRPGYSSVIWGLIVKLASGYHPTTYSYQKSLPFLPVPQLQSTMKNFLQSIEPLYGKNSEKYLAFQQQAKEFEKGLGVKLQRILTLKSWWAQNWVTDWWEKYVYLMSRNPIAINSNYYVLDHSYWQPTTRQVSRASLIAYRLLMFKRLIDREELEPLRLRGTIPLCMAQYERIFSTTRIPGEDVDELLKYDSSISKHIMVVRNGIYYKLDVFDVDGNLLIPETLEKQFAWIINDADKHVQEYSEGARSLAALTATERTAWAQTRNKYFSSGINKDSLDMLQKAMFVLILENKSFSTWNERGKYLLHGDGKTIWFDKSFNMIVFADGRVGINAEHAFGDAPVIGHAFEFALTQEVLFNLYDHEGWCWPMSGEIQATVKSPVRLVWDVPQDLSDHILNSVIPANVKANDDLDLLIVDHNHYGKGFIKTCKVSPDAYVQVALQLAYYKENERFAQTYESSMTRLYLLGRTETVRSLTMECTEFVRAMQSKGRSNEECIELLRRACNQHQTLYRDAMCGKGIDRHLFGLFVVCKGLGYESEFLKNVLTIPWTLSTSQQPQQQIANSPDCNLPHYNNKVSPGGGFGPVSDEGYGVSYMLPGDGRIFFHVSSKKSSGLTNSERFVKLLYESLDDMKNLFTVSGKASSK